MSDADRGVLIIGGGLGAVRTAEQLRRAEFSGPITIVSSEAHLPYDRPPLSKDVLRDAEKTIDAVVLKPREFYDEKQIELRLGAKVVALDPAARTATLDDGSTLEYGEAVIATGLVPRRIAAFPELDGIHVLRTADDSFALRGDAAKARRAVVVGAGFIGCEVASTLRANGVDVVLVEPQPAPLLAAIGQQLGDLVARLHRNEGVDVRVGIGVDAVEGDGRVQSVTLSDGTRLDSDLVVLGIGSRPATDWLDGSGVEVNNGVVCDAVGRTGTPHVWALGDVAAWADADGRPSRVEHWSNVADQVRALVPALLGQEPAANAAAVPYFWSDQYDVKIQSLGHLGDADTVHLISDDGRKFLAYLERDGVLTGVVGCGMAGPVMKMRAKIAAGTPIADVLE
ncbi:FAD-dependent oxidoreductase [Mycobacteroides chelonae]|uniref:FAD-dependent oxidoreductase n=1 Tax=Mycobacteroides chelonae TaxID=1774 RepID=A0AB73U6F8_MYCCH|nr:MULTISPECIES: FAD-dependent oxidoreductase [Mycobacteroides]KRQ22170.1 pyridine nucleotide-disulfide oxidoreductase [Mycobacteroides sp. H072]KRQ30702.1 pyridine nucleotide-disulfide oxidoreductase [Mycobacteroides sp. H002]KRQ51403.1 pyridine nucleotide-disulfide oxidoreductase [Mycobacteroides sp. H054]KRQ69917.1 pyridine nucleotide-disulfide oxidoreductase [Mycobacteroides sp. H001]MBF9348427.1 FAD-dependent oxidoreductase [Mycobacteroides chelonae]